MAPPPCAGDVAPALLEVRGLSKRFGGLVATDAVNLSVRPNEIHALIGPNGAGKTTLVAQLAGQLASDAGSVHFDGADITRLVAHQRAQRGLVRSFQITRLFSSLTVLENMALAAQAVPGGAFECSSRFSMWRHVWHPVRADNALRERTVHLLDQIGLADKQHCSVDQLAHGEQRALEVGMTLATHPLLVLLDEPLAGMSAQESAVMTALVATLRQHCAVLLIEHDVQAVFALADRVSVLVAGSIVACDAPERVRRDPAVMAAYLGDDAEAS